MCTPPELVIRTHWTRLGGLLGGALFFGGGGLALLFGPRVTRPYSAWSTAAGYVLQSCTGALALLFGLVALALVLRALLRPRLLTLTPAGLHYHWPPHAPRLAWAAIRACTPEAHWQWLELDLAPGAGSAVLLNLQLARRQDFLAAAAYCADRLVADRLVADRLVGRED